MLTSKRHIDSNRQSNRDELLRSSAVRERQDLNEKVTYVPRSMTYTAQVFTLQFPSEDALMRATNDVTEALQRTIGIMQGELERSVLSSQLLGKPSTSTSDGLTLTFIL